MDVTGKTVTSADMLNGVTALKNDGTDITGSISAMTLPSASSSTSSGTSKATITPTSSAQYLNIPAGYLDTAMYYTIAAGGGGGASNVVTGTFKGTTTGAAMDVDLSYTGSGYPIAVVVYPSDGYQTGSTIYSMVHRYGVVNFSGVKRNFTSPTYATSGSANYFSVYATYKSSASQATSINGSGSYSIVFLSGSNASSGASTSVVTFKTNTKMSVFISDSSYGFIANANYKYWVIYSS